MIGLALLGPVGELFPAIVPASLVGREVRDHRRQRRTHRAHRGGDRTAARCGRFRSGLVDEFFECQIDERSAGTGTGRYILLGRDGVLDDLFLRLEGVEVVEAERLDGDLDELLVGHAHRALLFLEEIPSRVEHGTERNQPDQFRAGHANAARLGRVPGCIIGLMHRSYADVGQVVRHLGDAVFLDEPADALDAFEFSGDPNVAALLVFDDRPGQWIAVAFLAALLTDVEGDGVRAARRGRV